MTLRNARVLDRLVDGVGSPRVLALAVVLVAVVGAWNVLLDSLLTATGVAAAAGVVYAVRLPVSAGVAAAGLAAATLLGTAALTALVRAFARDADPLGGSGGLGEAALAYGRSLVVAVGGTLAVAVGLVLLVLPGLVVLVHLPFAFVAVAAEGRSVAEAVGVTWWRVEGNRPGVVALVAAVGALPVAVAVAGPFVVGASPTVDLVAGVLVTGLAGVVGAAAFTATAETLDADATADRATAGRGRSATSRQL